MPVSFVQLHDSYDRWPVGGDSRELNSEDGGLAVQPNQ